MGYNKGLTETQQLLLAYDIALDRTISELRQGKLSHRHVKIIAAIKQLSYKKPIFTKDDIKAYLRFIGYEYRHKEYVGLIVNDLLRDSFIKPLAVGQQWFKARKYEKTAKVDYFLRRFTTHLNWFLRDNFEH